MNSRILVVDDEKSIVDVIKSNLEREGYFIETAGDGKTALDLALNNNFDLIILDCMLPVMDGFDVCKKIRQESPVPIIMLTAKSEEIDKVLGLELGADDYMTKPFSMRELLARVKAQIRRSSYFENSNDSAKNSNEVTVIGDIKVDNETFEVHRDGENVNLTLREFQLVAFLANHAGQVFTREELLQEVWEYEYYGDVRTVDVTVRRAREKLEPDTNDYKYIITKRGVGYYFNKDL
ncbi:response regulator transcription factor [Fastidiosipila sanguinis]|uniref:Stage 0 sporulation protein A homolog n=1 Tax=Fastidiosipila sanguinis TaxID=236753 RepID=A0A2S0KNM0_9FIRM|nr:response regulator transcription factor [Fastidiosipila sanguinis]AVM42608.1 DNA-binding response regulator [Fastidiosipila sanguinis]